MLHKDGQKDAGQKVIRKVHLSIQLRWAKQQLEKYVLLVHDKNVSVFLITLRIETFKNFNINWNKKKE